MEVMTRKKKDYHFTRKLTDEEIEQLIEDYDYDLKYLDPDYDDEDEELDPVWDKYGNPTESTIRAMYESRHGIYDEMTAEEAVAEIHEACSGNSRNINAVSGGLEKADIRMRLKMSGQK